MTFAQVEWPAPHLESVMDLAVDVGAPLDVGQTSQGVHRLVPILGGTVSMGHVKGRILVGGTDLQRIVGGEVDHLDARYCIELNDGAYLRAEHDAARGQRRRHCKTDALQARVAAGGLLPLPATI